MPQISYPEYLEEDSLYVSSIGMEYDGRLARWGPGRRRIGIVHYVISGEGIFNGHKVKENQGFYIEPGLLCEYYPDGDNPWNYVWIDCSAEFAQRYVLPTVKPDENGVFVYDYQPKLLKYFERIFDRKSTVTRIEAMHFAFSVLALHTQDTEASGTQHYIRKAKSFIESSMNRKLTVCDVADAISIHDRYLYSLFVRYEGIPPKEYILMRKMETAADLLAHTELSITEIANAVGFADVYGFSRLFRQKTKLSPTAYRKTITGK